MNHDYTIGLAGHIDHGKTTLTKALTGVDTDHLKEEKERKISIEPGFAPWIQEDNLEVSFIDVPGHERFIRQMIAGVAGIDVVLVVIAANEGIMPQTREHVQILSLLGIDKGFIVLTKLAETDEDLVEMVTEDVKENFQETFLRDAPMYGVDSLSGQGISLLTKDLRTFIEQLPPKDIHKPFRLPIDHVFTVKGQGVVVRGTIFSGQVKEGDRLRVLPADHEVRIRQIQRHRKQEKVATAGQRTAINLGGISHEDVERGDVLVADDSFVVSDRLDLSLQPLPDVRYPLKQRQVIKFHMGTSEVMGQVIFFDRNEINGKETEEVLCQIQLETPIVVARGDRFIMRRPTPVETIGGGWVIDPEAGRYRFGVQTIERLRQKKEGSLQERVLLLFQENSILTMEEIQKQLAISSEGFQEVEGKLRAIKNHLYTAPHVFNRLREQMIEKVAVFHTKYPLRMGINKAELISSLSPYPAVLMDEVLTVEEELGRVQLSDQFVSLAGHTPSLPNEWREELISVKETLISQGTEPKKWEELLAGQHMPTFIQQDFYHYLLQMEQAYVYDNERLIAAEAVETAREKLLKATAEEGFTLQRARDVLQLSRKNLIPLLELFDALRYTVRKENKRFWL